VKKYVFMIAVLFIPALFSTGTPVDARTGGIDLASIGYLQVQSPVEGARVYFDRQFMGFINDGAITVPVDVTASPQYKNLIIEYTGYQRYIGPLPTPVPGKTVGIRVELNRNGYEMTGLVRFECEMSGAELLLDGKSMGFTPDSGILVIHTVPNGLYEFTVKRPGNLTINRQHYVTTNAVTLFRVILEPALFGDMQVRTTPEGADIYIDNRLLGVSPLFLPDIPVGDQRVRITCNGYQEWTGNVTINSSGLNKIDAVLVSSLQNPTVECPTAVQA
jgi:hypothetical protein